MKVSVKWLNDYTPVTVNADQLAERMIAIGNEVEEVIYPGKEIDNVITGRVTAMQHHPDADKLWICQVDTGSQQLQIVTGASNLTVGDVVPVAVVGAHLPGGVVIKNAKLRGVPSTGMLVSGEELGINNGHYPGAEVHGILILDPDTPLGVDVLPLVGLDSPVLDFKPLANRPDCLSVLGLAGEVSAGLGQPLTRPSPSLPAGLPASAAQVEIQAPELCTRYVAQLVRGVKIGPSPAWMRHRLLAAGIRPINNVVDITNFVMLEYGQPLHAFDLRQLASPHIIVRRANPGETLELLDGKQLELTADHLCICDERGPVALAGIMGGERSGIADDTCDVLLESAMFVGPQIRQTARYFGLRTEASARYEKGVDAAGVPHASARAAMLMVELCGGRIEDAPAEVCIRDPQPTTLTASCQKIVDLLGVQITPDQMVGYLNALHLPATTDQTTLTVTVPPVRGDIQHHADLAEEIMRMHGYEHIPVGRLTTDSRVGTRMPAREARDHVQQVLCGLGLYEAMHYSFIGPEDLARIGLEDTPLVLKNPLNEELSRMRTSLVPGMLRSIALNDARRNGAVRLYEISKVFIPHAFVPDATPDQKLPAEPWRLCLGMQLDTDFYGIKAVVQAVCDSMGYAVDYRAGGPDYYHPGRRAEVLLDGCVIGTLGEIHPTVAQNLGLRSRAYTAELDLDALIAAEKKPLVAAPLPRTPAITRDLALVVDEAVPAGELLNTLRTCAGRYLVDCQVFDVYRGAPLAPGTKSLAFSLAWRNEERGLTDQDLVPIIKKLLDQCAKRHGATLRE